MSCKELPILRDFTTHPYDEITPTSVQNMYNFKATLLGEGCLSFINPKQGLGIFYLKCLPTESFIIESTPYKEDTIAFNYLLKASKNFISRVMGYDEEENLSDRVLIVDNTNTKQSSIQLQEAEKLEIVQINLSKEIFNMYFDRFMKGYSDDIKQKCWNSFYSTEQFGILLPFDIRSENCLTDMIYSTFDGPLHHTYTELKVTELLLYYFQYIISDDITVADNRHELSLSAAEKQTAFDIKHYLDTHTDQSGVSILEQEFALTMKKLNTIFRHVFGMSISNYHRKQRINKAYLLLLNNKQALSIKQIAYSVGFNSVQSFSRSFFNEFKIRPTDVRLKVTGRTKVV